jgi:hypothetical protein
MSRRNYTDITIVFVILFFDALVYKYQGVNCSNVILRCYPTSKIFLFKDSNGNIKYETVIPTRRIIHGGYDNRINLIKE